MYVMTAAALAAALSPAATVTEPSRSAVVGRPSPMAVSDGDHHKRKAAAPSRGGRADDDDDEAIVVTGEARDGRELIELVAQALAGSEAKLVSHLQHLVEIAIGEIGKPGHGFELLAKIHLGQLTNRRHSAPYIDRK